jgi:hypothetical protein
MRKGIGPEQVRREGLLYFMLQRLEDHKDLLVEASSCGLDQRRIP